MLNSVISKVLVIDDEPEICEYLREILESIPYDVTTTQKGRDALRLISELDFDIIISDVRLPDLDGVSILEHLRLTGCETPFVMMTGFSTSEPIISGIRLGAADFLSKPFTPHDLQKAMHRALQQKRRTAWGKNLCQISAHPTLSLQEKIQGILHLSREMLGMNFGFVARYHTQAPVIAFHTGLIESGLTVISDAFDQHVLPILPSVPQNMQLHFQAAASADDFSWVAQPLRVNQLVFGILCFAQSGPRATGFAESERTILQMTELAISRLMETEENSIIIANQKSLIMAAQNLSNIGALATSIVHEIENHLTVIAGRAMIVEKMLGAESAGDSSRMKVVLNSIGKDVKRIDRIVKSVRTLAHSGSDPLTKQLLHIKTIVDEAIELFRCKTKSRSIQLTVADIPADISLYGDPTQLLQAILILLNNSFDAIEGLEVEWIRLDATLADDSLLLAFTDSGHGISEAIQERIFEAFFTTKQVGKGLGVGLHLARKYIEANHGKLWIDKNCQNTCFVIQLFQLVTP